MPEDALPHNAKGGRMPRPALVPRLTRLTLANPPVARNIVIVHTGKETAEAADRGPHAR